MADFTDDEIKAARALCEMALKGQDPIRLLRWCADAGKALPATLDALEQARRERDAALAESDRLRELCIRAEQHGPIRPDYDATVAQLAEAHAVMARQAGTVIELRAALEEAIDLAEEAWECADSEHEPSKEAGLAEIAVLKAKVQP